MVINAMSTEYSQALTGSPVQTIETTHHCTLLRARFRPPLVAGTGGDAWSAGSGVQGIVTCGEHVANRIS